MNEFLIFIFAVVADCELFDYIADVCHELAGAPSVFSRRLPHFPISKWQALPLIH
jgi:hypothetical protein